jgi:hypothetical protein
MTKQYRSRVLASVHETAEGLTGAGVMSKQTMREFDELCLTPVRPLTPSSIRRHRLWPAYPLPKPPPRQIPIDRKLSTQPPRVPSWEAFGRRSSSRADRSRLAGIRNPSAKRTCSQSNGCQLIPSSFLPITVVRAEIETGWLSSISATPSLACATVASPAI